MFFTKISHDLELKRLERHVKHTQDLGPVLDPNYYIFKVYAFPDDDFSGIYGHKNTNNSECAKNLTGFIIKFSDFPFLFIYRFKTETTLSTM